MSELIERFFAPQGLMAKRFNQHEDRPGQDEMALLVYRALHENTHAAIQAGTGMGKTFAYLVSAALFAVESKKKVVVSTATLNLQSQIIEKDIPTLQQILGRELGFTAALVKGRGNYLCIRKLTAFAQANMQYALYNDPGDAEQWPQIADLFFDKKLHIGDRAEIPFRVSDTLWADIGSEADVCMRAQCPFIGDCFFYRARQEQREAQLLITNHALFFADLVIRREQARQKNDAEFLEQQLERMDQGSDESFDAVLAQYDAVIFDEAQSIEDFATDCFTARFSWDRLLYLSRSAASALRPGGMLQWADDLDYQRIDALFNVLLQRAESFFYSLSRRWDTERSTRFTEPFLFEEDLSEQLEEIALELTSLQGIAESEEQKIVLAGLARRTREAAHDLMIVREMPEGDDYAYWLETGERQLRQIKLAASPVSVSDLMQENLFERVPVVLTSATLASELVQRLGLIKPRWMRLDSPFDYRRHARLYLPNDAPEATPQNEQIFAEFVAGRVPELTAMSKGRAFILFTSYRAMQSCYATCADAIREQGWLVLIQGEKRRELLLQDFITHGSAVLFAVNSFWEGVDVPGEALSLVVLVKLPFAVPNEPIQQARMEALQREGKDPFKSYSLPQAALRLKQGFGRLIRTRQDTGVIAVLDKRILTKYYGQRFLRDLPAAPQVQRLEEVAAFFTLLDEAKTAQAEGISFVWPEAEVSDRTASPVGSQVVDAGWWLPEDEVFADTDRRHSGFSSREPRPNENGDEARRSSSRQQRTVQSAEDIVFDDLPPNERKRRR